MKYPTIYVEYYLDKKKLAAPLGLKRVYTSDGSVVSFQKTAVAVIASVVVFLKTAVAVLMRLC